MPGNSNATWEHIVVPLDGSDLSLGAVGPASHLARKLGSRLILCSQVYPHEKEPNPRQTARHDFLSKVASEVHEIDVVIDVRAGLYPQQILSAIMASYANPVLCMSTHGRGRVAGTALGSVAEEVVRRQDDPAVLVGPNHDRASVLVEGTVLMCLDGSALAEGVIPHVKGWARQFSMPVRVLQVLPVGWEDRLVEYGVHRTAVRENLYAEQVAEELRQQDIDAECVIDEITSDQGPAHGILRQIDAQEAGLVALSTHARTGLERLRIGSVTTSVLRESRVAALVHGPGRE
jgi:nucleotide-binding universal stress UspA family protein